MSEGGWVEVRMTQVQDQIYHQSSVQKLLTTSLTTRMVLDDKICPVTLGRAPVEEDHSSLSLHLT